MVAIHDHDTAKWYNLYGSPPSVRESKRAKPNDNLMVLSVKKNHLSFEKDLARQEEIKKSDI